MNRKYLDLCNEVIDIMSYLPVKDMDGLNTPEGRLIKLKINDVLREICCGEHGTWKFRERNKTFSVAEGQQEYHLPEGHILFIRPDDDSNRPPLVYNQNWKYLPLSTSGQPVYYWIYEDKIQLYPTPSQSQDGEEYKIRYLTDKYAVDRNGCGKDVMEEYDDEPIIPEKYRSLLVYGVVRDFRASLGDSKSEFYRRKYNALYNKMLSNQRLTEDYIKGGRIATAYPTSLRDKIEAFKNPYATGWYRRY